MTLAATIADRCDRCTCQPERQELLRDAVVEAARHVMAWHLREERNLPEYARTLATTETVEALQGLRDALSCERAARHG
jgi:GMP synthase-like glutamine amidotransferase